MIVGCHQLHWVQQIIVVTITGRVLIQCLIKAILYHSYQLNKETPYNHIMITLKSVCFLALTALVLGGTCTPPSTIFSSSSIASNFDRFLSTLHYDSSAFDLISNPNYETFKSYFLSNGKYFIPLWCLGGVTLVLFMLCSLQLCCYHCCGQQSCGSKINKKSYRPCCLSIMVYAYLFLSLALIGLGIVSFLLSSDLLKQADYTICSVDNTFNQLFDGKPEGSTPPWSGVDNFNSYASQISTNFPSVVNNLATIFTSAQYQNIVSNTSGSLYSNAVAPYSCPASLASSTVSCPFPNISSCFNGLSTQIPTFSFDFCNNTVDSSASSQVLNQQKTNSTTWRTNLMALSSNLTAYSSSNPNFAQLLQQSENLQSSITQYKPQLANGILAAQNHFHEAEIGMYTVFGLFIFIGLIAFISVFCTYCVRSYGWRFALYFLWIFFMLLGVLFFVASGFFLVGTFTGYDSCKVYAQLTLNQTAMPSLSYYKDSSVTEVLFTCFFPPNNSTDTIFNSVSQQTNFQQLNELQNQYYSVIPSSLFSTVATKIKYNLNFYSTNQNDVTFVGASASQNPQAALDQANVFASNGGSSACNAVDDTFVFNPSACYPLLLNQAANNPSCILLSSSSGSIVSSRQNSFITHNCASNYTKYTSYFNSLNSYGEGIATLASQYTADSGLNTYENSFFNYYKAVNDFMSTNTKNLFNSFITPYSQLVQGSSCSFLTGSLNSLATNICDNDFPYLYVLSLITIALSCIFLLMMILSYYLTTRMEFYEHLNGDLSKYDPEAPSDDSIKIEMADFTNREQLLTEPQPVKVVKEVVQQPPERIESRQYKQQDNREVRHNNDRYGYSDPRYRYHRYNRYEDVHPQGLASPPKNLSQQKK